MGSVKNKFENEKKTLKLAMVDVGKYLSSILCKR